MKPDEIQLTAAPNSPVAEIRRDPAAFARLRTALREAAPECGLQTAPSHLDWLFGAEFKDAIVLIHSLDSPPSEFIPDGSGQLTDGRGTVTVALKTRHRELFVFASLANGSKTAEAVIKANEMGLFQSRLRLHLEEEIK